MVRGSGVPYVEGKRVVICKGHCLCLGFHMIHNLEQYHPPRALRDITLHQGFDLFLNILECLYDYKQVLTISLLKTAGKTM